MYMLKTKYDRMKPYEKKKTIELYKNTNKGKEMMKRLLRLNIIGTILILYAIYTFVSDIKDLHWTNYLISIPLIGIGLFFIIMSYRLRKKVLNQFAIKQK